MIEAILFILLSLQNRPTPAQADAIVLAYVSTPQPLPQNLPIELGPALNRFWKAEQVWGEIHGPWTQDRIRSEIEWTRNNWPCDLPPVSELERTPTIEEARRTAEQLRIMRANLEQLAELAPPWEKENVWIQRGELDACQCFNDAVQRAHHNAYQPLYRRQALGEIRATLGDEAYYSGNWPTVPYWRIPLTK